ncbi:hypothetical protein VTN02DRAFT_1651 [Thermoascus thermophilus]
MYRLYGIVDRQRFEKVLLSETTCDDSVRSSHPPCASVIELPARSQPWQLNMPGTCILDPGGRNRVAGPDGLAPLKGNRTMAERAASWPWLVSLVNSYVDTNCRGVDPDRPPSCELGNRASDVATISWTWQYCTQWGYFQSNNFGPRALLSRYQTLDYYQSLCYRQFPGALARGLLPAQPLVAAVNHETGGWAMRPSNVYWSGGQFDPWRALSPLSSEPFAPRDVELVTDPPACDVRTGQNRLFGYVMDGAEHCFDFNPNFAPGEVSRGYFVRALKEWLKCFKKAGG